MRIQQSSKKRSRWIIIATTIIIVALSSLAVWYYLKFNDNNNQSNDEAPTATNSTDANSAGRKDQDDNDTKTDSSASNQTVEDTPVASDGTIVIQSLEQSSGAVRVAVVVTNFTVATCVYNFMSSEAKPIVREMSGSCNSISIPETEFTYIGTYTLAVNAYNANGERLSTSKDINIQ